MLNFILGILASVIATIIFLPKIKRLFLHNPAIIQFFGHKLPVNETDDAQDIRTFARGKALNTLELKYSDVESIERDPDIYEVIDNWICSPVGIPKPDFKIILRNHITEDEIRNSNNLKYLTWLFDLIDDEKRKRFRPEALANLKTVQDVSCSINNMSKEILVIKDIMNQNKVDVSDNAGKIEVIKKLLEDGKIISARNSALDILSSVTKLSQTDIIKLNSIIAETYLSNPSEQCKSIQYLEVVRQCSMDPITKLRIEAIINLLSGDNKNAKVVIQRALKINTGDHKTRVVELNIITSDATEEELDKLREDKNYSNHLDFQLIICSAYIRHGYWKKGFEIASILKRDNPKLPDALYWYAHAAINMLNNEFRENPLLTEDQFNLLRDISTTLAECEKSWPNEKTEILSNVYTLHGHINYLLMNDKKSLDYLNKALECTPNNKTCIINLVNAQFSIHDFHGVLTSLDNLEQLQFDKVKINVMRAEAFNELGKTKDAMVLLNELLKNPDLSIDALDTIYAILVQANLREMDFHASSKIYGEFIVNYGFGEKVICSYALVLNRQGRKGEAISLLKTALQQIKNRRARKIEVLLADYLVDTKEINQIKEACNLYEMNFSIYTPDRISLKYLRTLYYTSEFGKCLRLCNTIKKIHGPKIEYTEIEAYIYVATDNFGIAIEILKALIAQRPYENELQLQFAYSLFRLGRINEAEGIIEAVSSKCNESLQDLAMLSRIFLQIKEPKKALEFAFRGLKADPDNPKAHSHYIFIFQACQSFIKPTEEQVLKFQDIINNFSKKFPDIPYLRTVEVSNDPEEFRNQIFQMLKENKYDIENIRSSHLRFKLPTYILANLLRKDVITTWTAMLSDSSLPIYCATGIIEELNNEVKLCFESKSVLIDLIPLLSLSLLEHREKLLDVFDIIYIKQHVIDIINSKIELLSLSIKDGHIQLYENNGKMFTIEIPKEAVENQISFLQKIIDFTLSHPKIKIIGKIVDLNQNSTNVPHNIIDNVLTKEMWDVFCDSAVKGVPAYIEDFTLRHLAREMKNTTSFGTQAVLTKMLKHNIISEEEFQAGLAKLVHCNYQLINISAQTLLQNLRSCAFYPKEEVLSLFLSLRNFNIHETLLNLGLGFFKELWIEPITPEQRKEWTFRFLDMISIGKSKSRIVQFYSQNSQLIFGQLLFLNETHFKESLKDWLANQVFIN